MHQHPGLFPDLTVFENIFIGHMPNGSLGVDYEAMRERTARLLGIVGLSCRSEDTLKRLRTSEQQLVEIARLLSVNAKVCGFRRSRPRIPIGSRPPIPI